MTFSINPTANKTQAQFMELAKQQNGTVTAGSGGSGSYSAPPTAASASPVAASAPSLANLAAPPPAQTGSVISGGAGGQCACSCLCGTAAFPAGAGIGMYGGMPGLFFKLYLRSDFQESTNIVHLLQEQSLPRNRIGRMIRSRVVSLRGQAAMTREAAGRHFGFCTE